MLVALTLPEEIVVGLPADLLMCFFVASAHGIW